MTTPEPPEGEQPHIDAATVAYGWLEHIAEMCRHAMDDLAVMVPEEARAGATERARARAGAFHLGLRYTGQRGAVDTSGEEIPE